MARLNFSSLIETPLSKAQQVAGFLNKNIPFGRNNRTQLEMDRVLTKGANINGDQLDFATQNEELIEAQRMGPQPQSMGDRVLAGLKDIASRPETYRNLATIGSILASAQGEQNLANTLSTVSNRIDQGIVREENKAILADQQAKEDIRQAEISAAREAKRQRDLAEANRLRAEGLNTLPPNTPKITKEEYENLPKILEPYKYKAENEGMVTKYGISRDGLQKKLDLQPIARKELRQARDDEESMTRNVDSLLDAEKEFKSLVGGFKAGIFNIPKAKLKEKTMTLTDEEKSFIETLDTITSDKFLNVLKSTRSPKTGATGFGQLTEREFDLLKNAMTSLRATQDPKKFRENLIFVRDTLKRARDRAERDYKSLYGDLPAYRSLSVYNDQNLPTGGIERGTETVTDDSFSDEEVKRVLGLK